MKAYIKDNRGFSLVELIVVIAITVILIALLVPNVFAYVQNARDLTVKSDAHEVYTAAQTALIDVRARNPHKFMQDMQYGTYKGKQVGCFTNHALSYNQANSGSTNGSGISDSDDAVSLEMLKTLGWEDANTSRYPFKESGTPFGMTVSDYEAAHNQPGLILVYDMSGSIIYMEWGIDGCLAKVTNNGATIELERNGVFAGGSNSDLSVAG